MKHSELRHQPRHVNPRIQAVISEHFTITPETLAKQGVSGQIKEKQNND